MNALCFILFLFKFGNQRLNLFFHGIGMSVSYDRVMEVRKGLAISVSRRCADDGVVTLSNLRRGVFTTVSVDNMDESGRLEFHSTAISLTNHPAHDTMGVAPPPLTLNAVEGATIKLTDDFTIVPYIDEYAVEITLSSIPNGTAMPVLADNPQEGVPEEAQPCPQCHCKKGRKGSRYAGDLLWILLPWSRCKAKSHCWSFPRLL